MSEPFEVTASDGTRWVWSPELRVWNGWRHGEDGLWERTGPEMQRDYPEVIRRVCARCKTRPRSSLMTGRLCEQCEDDIDGMSQDELDEDERRHTEDVAP